jgi:hypothetical protein
MTDEAKKPAAKKYKVLAENGIAYPDASGKEKRVKGGTIVDDIPAVSIKWLVAQGIVEEN